MSRAVSRPLFQSRLETLLLGSGLETARDQAVWSIVNMSRAVSRPRVQSRFETLLLVGATGEQRGLETAGNTRREWFRD